MKNKFKNPVAERGGEAFELTVHMQYWNFSVRGFSAVGEMDYIKEGEKPTTAT